MPETVKTPAQVPNNDIKKKELKKKHAQQPNLHNTLNNWDNNYLQL